MQAWIAVYQRVIHVHAALRMLAVPREDRKKYHDAIKNIASTKVHNPFSMNVFLI